MALIWELVREIVKVRSDMVGCTNIGIPEGAGGWRRVGSSAGSEASGRAASLIGKVGAMTTLDGGVVEFVANLTFDFRGLTEAIVG